MTYVEISCVHERLPGDLGRNLHISLQSGGTDAMTFIHTINRKAI